MLRFYVDCSNEPIFRIVVFAMYTIKSMGTRNWQARVAKFVRATELIDADLGTSATRRVKRDYESMLME